MARRSRGTRPAEKREMICSYLRGKIGSGMLKAGERLPTQLELAHEFDVSPVTVQAALSLLAREGFLHADVPRGTFVTDRPPHLSRFALVMSDDPCDRNFRSRYLDTLVHVARELEREEGIQLPVFHQALDRSSRDFGALIEDVREHRLGGLMLCVQPHHFVGTPVMDEPGIPRVILGSLGDAVHGIPSVVIGDLLGPAFARLQRLGRRRAAVLVNGMLAASRVEQVITSAARYGITIEPAWVQAVHIASAGWAVQSARLLFDRRGEGLPDALVITDDHLVEPATAGLVAAGVRAPDEVTIVAHCNFPLPPPSQLPVLRIGSDIPALLRAGIGQLQAQRRDEPIAMCLELPSVFEDERSCQVR